MKYKNIHGIKLTEIPTKLNDKDYFFINHFIH